MDSGYSITIVSAEETPGLFFRPTFGVDFRVGTGKLSLQTSYKVQHINYKYFGTFSEDHISCNAEQVEVAISYSFWIWHNDAQRKSMTTKQVVNSLLNSVTSNYFIKMI